MNLASGFRGGERQTELLIRALADRGRVQRLVIRKGNSLAQRCADIPGSQSARSHRIRWRPAWR